MSGLKRATSCANKCNDLLTLAYLFLLRQLFPPFHLAYTNHTPWILFLLYYKYLYRFPINLRGSLYYCDNTTSFGQLYSYEVRGLLIVTLVYAIILMI
jgi:hypothetical protein